jgi:hypothetical protein
VLGWRRAARTTLPFLSETAGGKAEAGEVAGGTVGCVAKATRRGRVEAGLERDLIERHDIGAAERSALRAQARAVDLGEAGRDSDAVTRANACYLELRQAAGLTSAGTQPVDAIDSLMAELMRPGAGAFDRPNT